jgi:hypothetical protein
MLSPMEHPMNVSGGCHCGAIAFEAEVDPKTVGICHCTDCQRLSGSAYRVSVPAPRATFRLLRGTPKTYVKTADSGNKRVHAFCGDCGTPIYACAISDPPTYSLRVGNLKEGAQLPPQRQIWCHRAFPWSANIEAVPKA